MSNDETAINCNGFLAWLTILFIGLKLTHYIDWSWFWILSPIIIPFGIIFCSLGIVGILIVITKAISFLFDK